MKEWRNGGREREREMMQGIGKEERRHERRKTLEYSSLALLNFHAVGKVVMREEMV